MSVHLETQRRIYFPHPAHRTVGVARRVMPLRGAPALHEVFEPVRAVSACLVGGALKYHGWHDPLEELEAYLKIVHGLHIGRMSCDNILCDVGQINEVQSMLLYGPALQLSHGLVQSVDRFCKCGGPLLGVRTADRTCYSWPALDRDVFGAAYRGQYADMRCPLVEIAPRQLGHPLLDGVEPFVARGRLHKNRDVADDVTVLLTAKVGDHTEPAAWIRSQGGRRVFYTSIGHPADFLEPPYLRLLANAVRWATRQ